MLTFFVVILTIALVTDCLLLGLLILVQLPKKDAGVGMAFGGGAADALFGAGSGTALTKLTKYTAAIFFVLVVLLSIAESRQHNSGFSSMSQQAERFKKDAAKNPVTPPADSSAESGSNAAVIEKLRSALANVTNLPSNTTNTTATNTAATNPPPNPAK